MVSDRLHAVSNMSCCRQFRSALLGLLTLIAVSGVFGWDGKQNYVYKAKSRLWSTLNGHSETGFSWEGRLRINWISDQVMTGYLTDMTSFYFDETQPIEKFQDKSLEAHFTTDPFEVEFEEGLVSDLRVSEGTQEWEIEVIRAVVGQLQISSEVSKRNEFTTFEESVTGNCETKYSVKLVGGVNVVLKSKDYVDCTKQRLIQKGVFGKENWEAIMKSQNIFRKRSNSEITTIGNWDNYRIQYAETEHEIDVVSQDNKTSVTSQISLRFLSSFESNFEINNENKLVSVKGLSSARRFGSDYYLSLKHVPECHNDSNRQLLFIEMISKITRDMTDPAETVKLNTLDRYTVLVQLIQNLDEHELREISAMVGRPNWDVFLMAVTDSGTLPSLKLLRNLIKSARLDSKHAHLLVDLPTNVHPLSLEYLNTFFNMIKNDIPKGIKDLQGESSLAFSNLVRRYVTEEELPFPRKELEKLLMRTYIPHFRKQLHRALIREDHQMIHVYIRSMGNLGHLNVIKIFQHYLSGDDARMSTYYKTLMVTSMDKLMEQKPDSVGRVLHKLFLEPTTEYSVRVAALYQILSSNPSHEFVRDLLTEARDSDWSDELKRVVKTSVMSSAYPYGSDEKMRELAETIVVPQPTSRSNSATMGYNSSDEMYISRNIFEVIKGFGDNPNYIRTLFEIRKQGFLDSSSFSFMFSNTERQFSESDQISDFYSFISRKPKPTPANMLIESNLEQYFFSSENFKMNAAFDRMQQWLSGKDWSAAESSFELNTNQVLVGFPTEAGFPFLYSHETPIMWYMKGPGQTTPTSANSLLAVNFHLVLSMRSQTKVSIANPLDGYHYVAGVDRNFQVNVPLSIEVGSDGPVKVLAIKPLPSETPQRIFHVSSWPYHSVRCLHPTQPVAEDVNTRDILDSFTVLEENFAKESHGVRIRAKTNRTSTDIFEYLGNDDVLFPDMNPFYHLPPHHELFNVFLDNSNSSLTFFLDASRKPFTETSEEDVGKIRGPFFFFGQQMFHLKTVLTGQTEHSISLTGKFASDISNVVKVSFGGELSENNNVVYEACQDTYIKTSELTESVIYGSVRFGKTCSTGSLISLETAVEPGFENQLPIELNVTVYHRNLDDDTAVKLCRLRDADIVPGNEDVKVNFVFEDQNELCDSLLSLDGPGGEEDLDDGL